MDYTLKQLLEVLDMKAQITIYETETECLFNGLVYESLYEFKNTKTLKREIERMYVSLGTIYVLLSERY